MEVNSTFANFPLLQKTADKIGECNGSIRVTRNFLREALPISEFALGDFDFARDAIALLTELHSDHCNCLYKHTSELTEIEAKVRKVSSDLHTKEQDNTNSVAQGIIPLIGEEQ